MRFEFEKAQFLDDAILIYSMWSGYLEDEQSSKFLDWLKSMNITLVKCHTSGHAPIPDLKRLAEAISSKQLVPIHTFEPERYSELFENVKIKDDREWWKV